MQATSRMLDHSYKGVPKNFEKILLFSFLIVSFSFHAHSQQFKQLQTEDLNLIYYSNAHSYIIPHLSNSFLNTYYYYKDFWNYSSIEPITIFLEDFSDWSNGGATATPVNFVFVNIAPSMYVFEVAPSSERMSFLMNHELTHVVAMDNAGRSEKFFRRVFLGKVQQDSSNPISLLYSYLTVPRKFAPRWFHEGIAVFMETWMCKGVGRALSSYDEMVFRAMVKDSIPIYHAVGLESEGTAIDFQVGANSYLYGARFFSYLAYEYGPKKLISWVNRVDASDQCFITQFRKIYGISLHDAWSEWIMFEHNWQERNLDNIKQHPLTTGKIITNKLLGSVSKSYFENEKRRLYTAIKFPGQLAQLGYIRIDDGKFHKLCDLRGASTYFTCSFVPDFNNNKIYYTTDNYTLRDLNVLDLKTRKTDMLIKNLRAGDLTFNAADSSLWAVRHSNGISTLIRLEAPYKDWIAIHAFPYGTSMYDIDISPDGKKLSGALTHIDGTQELALFQVDSLLQSNALYETVFDFGYSSPATFVFSSDGNFLYGTSYYTGVSNIFRYNIENNDMSVLTNTETGFFRPVPMNEDSLIAFEYQGGKGFSPVWIANEQVEGVSAIDYLGQAVVDKYHFVRDWNYGRFQQFNIDSLSYYQGDYKPYKNLKLLYAYPIIQGYKDYTAFGYYFHLADDINRIIMDASFSYSPHNYHLHKNESYHFSTDLRLSKWGLHLRYNYADFYDLFGPLKESRKGFSAGISYKSDLIYDKPKILHLSSDITAYTGLDELPLSQNITIDSKTMIGNTINLIYKNLQSSQGAVDDEKGFIIGSDLRMTYANNRMHIKAHGQFDYGIPLSLHHSSVWLRTSGGISPGRRNDPFDNFYFGGFRNNWVDNKEVQRYRECNSFPGKKINSISGTNFFKAMIELELPPIRFREVGIIPLYLRWMRTSIFTSALVTNIEKDPIRRSYFNIGAQIDFQLVALSLLKTYLSFGYALAVDNEHNLSRELMISVKLF